MYHNDRRELEVVMVSAEPGYSLRLQTATEDILMVFRLNPDRHAYVLDTSSLTKGAYWLLLRKDNKEVKRSIFQVI